MHIYTVYPKYLQSLMKFHAAILEKFRLQTVHYYTQYMTKIPSSKSAENSREIMESKFPE